MLHDAQQSMRDALAMGPPHCPSDLFAGPVDRTLLGLKAHANTIAHARHVAMEETFPRTRTLLGHKAFHALADQYLERDHSRTLAFAEIGRAFPNFIDGAACDLARLEWAWLEAHGAADAVPFDLSVIVGLTAAEVAGARVVRHPAARMTSVDHPRLMFDGITLNDSHTLVTRPAFDVRVTPASEIAARLFVSLERPTLLGEMLEADAPATTLLVTNGALMLALETIQ